MSTAQREDWLNAVASLLLPSFQEVAGIEAYPRFRVSCGFPSTGKRGKRIGECWYPGSSADASHELFIHPSESEPVQVAAILAHELGHVVAGPEAKHGPLFKRIIRPLGLEGKACATVPGEAFKLLIDPIIQKLGPYPHATLGVGISSRGPKQTTRMVKVTCGDCGYTLRSARSWLEIGVPSCPNPDCGNHGEEMRVA